MSFDDKEKLSQLMDGEWHDINTTKSVEAACNNDELKSKWSRYHLIRDVMRNDKVSVDDSLTSRICQAIDDEPCYSNISSIGARTEQGQNQSASVDSEAAVSVSAIASKNEAASASSWKAGLGGLAVAASVALATVVGLNVWQGAPGNNGSANQSIASTTSSSAPTLNVPGVVLPEVEYVSNRGSYWVTPEAKRSAMAEKRLNMLLSNHIELSPTAERSGMLPYSRLLGYDSVNPE